jgi:phenylpropionate dioxygenase-like ring-hydroxylating dioxygenase large terminal subunit
MTTDSSMAVTPASSQFVQHNWYVAAWSDEVNRTPLARVILGEPVVLYRRADGSTVALRDQCPHRKLPLSLGRLVDDNVECGYHGMTFAPDGHCVRIPGQERIPPGAKVRAFPTSQGMGMVWIWMGPPELAEQSERFHLAAFDDPNRALSVGKHRLVKCHYQLLTDNLTDPAHVSFVHRTTLGSTAQEDIPVSVHEAHDTVVVTRWTLDSPPAPIFKTLAGMTHNVDRWQYYYLHCPSICVVDFGSAPVGLLGRDSPRDISPAVQMYSCIFMTPASHNTTHYFYWQSRNFAVQSDDVSAQVLEQIEIAFEEDFKILEAQQYSMETYAVTDDVKLALDSAPTRQRRMVARLLEREQQTC